MEETQRFVVQYETVSCKYQREWTEKEWGKNNV